MAAVRDSCRDSRGEFYGQSVDNSEVPPQHRPGYNGIAWLVHTEGLKPIFVPAYAALDLEHSFTRDSLRDMFEPKHAALQLRQLTDRAVELSPVLAPSLHVRNWMRFEVVRPNAVGVAFRCRFRDLTFFNYGCAGLFWQATSTHRRRRESGFGASAVPTPSNTGSVLCRKSRG